MKIIGQNNIRTLMSSYRSKVLMIISSLFCVIIVLPTSIVMLSKETNAQQVETIENDVSKEVAAEVNELNFDVHVKRTATGEVEVVPLEQYVSSVVASEMPIDFEVEALKAQAVAARTYIINHLLLRSDEDEIIITDSTEHQVYKNEVELKELWEEDFYWKYEKVNQAVLATENEVLTYDSQPITPTFFSMSNGYTEDAEDYWGSSLPYLKKVESKWEESHPNFIEQTVFTKAELNKALGLKVAEHQTVEVKMKRTNSERVEIVEFGDAAFTGKEVREKLALRSNDFTVQQKNDHFIFTTKGFGHGVGMSQYGANGMAIEGSSYEDILHYYYQDITIEQIIDVAPALFVALEN